MSWNNGRNYRAWIDLLDPPDNVSPDDVSDMMDVTTVAEEDPLDRTVVAAPPRKQKPVEMVRGKEEGNKDMVPRRSERISGRNTDGPAEEKKHENQ